MALLLAASGAFWWQPWAPDVEPASIESMAFPLPEKPSIAVLPFDNLSNDPEQDYFADGFTNAIITNLSKFPELFVIAGNSVFTYKGKAVRVKDVGRDLGVRYVLEGSIQRGADQLTIHAQLIETAAETHVWAEQYDVALEEVFAVQKDLTQQISSTLTAAIIGLEQTVILKKDVATLPAYDLYLRAYKYSHGKEAYEESVRLLERAIELDPSFDEAYSLLSWRYLSLWRHNLADDPEEALRRARHYAREAIELDQQDYRSHWAFGTLYLFADQDHDLAVAEYDKAIALSPNQADLLAMMSLLMFFMGRATEAVDWIEKAKRLNPYHPVWYDWNSAAAYLMARDYGKALLAIKKTVGVYTKSIGPRRLLAVVYVEMGRMEEAKKVAQEILEINPGFTLSGVRNTPFQHEADHERYFGALRQAGLPE
jgi:TolB-like protein